MATATWVKMASVRLVLVLNCRDPGRLGRFWAEAIGYRQSSSADPCLVLVPRHGDGPELVLQRVPELKTAKNRVHLDVRVGQLEATVEPLTVLGARRPQAGSTAGAGFGWAVMADPEGNDCCACTGPQPGP